MIKILLYRHMTEQLDLRKRNFCQNNLGIKMSNAKQATNTYRRNFYNDLSNAENIIHR